MPADPCANLSLYCRATVAIDDPPLPAAPSLRQSERGSNDILYAACKIIYRIDYALLFMLHDCTQPEFSSTTDERLG
jgi:hypothetical protein